MTYWIKENPHDEYYPSIRMMFMNNYSYFDGKLKIKKLNRLREKMQVNYV